MENTPIDKASKSIRTFTLFLVIAVILSTISYGIFINRSMKVELFDELDHSLASLSKSILKLEFVLDIYLVGSQFDEPRVGLMDEDVENLELSVKSITQSKRFDPLFSMNKPLMDELKAIDGIWSNLSFELDSLSRALNRDEAILVHNSIDMNTFKLTEKVDRFLEYTEVGRLAAFAETKTTIIGSIIFIICFLTAGVVVSFGPVFSEFKGVIRVGEEMLKDEGTSVRFGTGGESALSLPLNNLTDMLRGKIANLNEKNHYLTEKIGARSAELASLMVLVSTVRLSLSEEEICKTALDEIRGITLSPLVLLFLESSANNDDTGLGSDGEDSVEESRELYLRSSSSAKVERGWLTDLKHLGVSETKILYDSLGSASEVASLDEGAVKGVFERSGYKSFMALPYGGSGLVLLAYEGVAINEDRKPYIEAAMTFLKSSLNKLAKFRFEHNNMREFERTVQQLPFGIGIFTPDGEATFLNSRFKNLSSYGTSSPSERVDSSYNLLKDTLLSEADIESLMEKSLGGDIHLVYKSSLSLKIETFPIYGDSGDITSVGVILEEHESGSAETKPGIEAPGNEDDDGRLI